MRLEKAANILTLARFLSSDYDGITLDEICERFGVKRRTAERMRDAVEQEFGPLEHIEDGRKRRFRLSARGLGSFTTAPTVSELIELEDAVRALEKAQAPERADQLRSLRAKIGASLREADRRRLTRDVADQLCSEELACRVGPRPMMDPSVLSVLREALLSGKVVRFEYGGDEEIQPRRRKVVPYGLIFGPRYYLVAGIKSHRNPALYRLDRIKKLQVTDESGVLPSGFELKAYAERSFGVFQEDPEEVVLRFAPSAVRDAHAYLFHPTQKTMDEPDGSLIVRFQAGAFLQIAHHLMTWGNAVTVLAPEKLKELMRKEVTGLYAHHVAPQAPTGSKRRPSTRNSRKSSSRKTPMARVKGS